MAVVPTMPAPTAIPVGPPNAKRQRIRNVILNLENCILSPEKLTNTPSMEDGLDPEVETDLRFIGCELIQSAGIILRLPQVAMATGQVLYQRFYYTKSFIGHNFEIVAMACIWVASKIEEAPRRLRDVLNSFHHLEQIRKKQSPPQVMLLDQHYMNLKNQVIKAERRILKELGFCVHVKHPHKMIVTLLEVVLRSESNDRLVQIAWNYMNDSLRSDIFVRHTPETIACACIHLAARIMQIPLPNSPPWYRPFGITHKEITDAATRILSVYARPKVDVDKVDKIVKDIRAKQQEQKRLKFETKPSKPPVADTEATENSNSINNHKQTEVTVPVSNGVKPVVEIKKDDGKDGHREREEPRGRESGSRKTSKGHREHENHHHHRDDTNEEDERTSRKRHKRRSRSRSVSIEKHRRHRDERRRRSNSRSRDRRRDRR